MAVYKDGIIGPFKGRVGNVVGYAWRGQWVMRSLPKPKKNRKPTEKQKANQARFALMQEYLAPRIDFIRKGFSLAIELNRMSPYNAAMSYNLSNATIGAYPDWDIDYSKVVFSQGELQLPKDIKVIQEGEELRVLWSTELTGDALNDDQAMIMLSGADGIYGKHNGSSREVGTDSIPIGVVTNGTELFVHIAFISDDRQHVSNSRYLGSLIVE